MTKTASNELAAAKKSRALSAFADNLTRLMAASKGKLNSNKKLADRARDKAGKELSYKTVERILGKAGHEPTLDTVEAIAKAFGLEAWQMLIPGLQPGERPEIRRELVIETAEV